MAIEKVEGFLSNGIFYKTEHDAEQAVLIQELIDNTMNEPRDPVFTREQWGRWVQQGQMIKYIEEHFDLVRK